MLRILLTLTLSGVLAGADYDAKMRASIARQQESVRRQAKGAVSTGFFTTPWLDAPAVATTSPAQGTGDCEPLPDAELGRMIASVATAEGVNPRLIEAMVAQESGGRPCAVSVRGARGLMQIMPATQAELGLADPFDAASNLAGGTRYLKQLLTRYRGNVRLALAAYNAGLGRVDSEQSVPRIPETEKYVSAIVEKAFGGQPPE